MKPEYTVACPRCGASKSKPCVSVGGNWSYPHAERSNIVLEAWRLGYADGVEQWAIAIERLEVRAENLFGDAEFIRRSVAERAEARR